MIYDEAIALLEGMRDRASSNSLSSSDKAYIKSLYFEICGKHVRNSSCNDCYRDAYIETYLTLKKQGKMVQQNYILKAGAIISRFGDNNFYALSNCPDEVAEEWLKEDPTRIGLFEKFPEDWQKRIASSEQQGEGNGIEGNGTKDDGTENPSPDPTNNPTPDQTESPADGTNDNPADGAANDADKADNAEATADDASSEQQGEGADAAQADKKTKGKKTTK